MSNKYEQARLDKLASLNLLDTLPETQFNDVVTIASLICETPVALISLIDRDRQWFKASVGLDLKETPRSIAFCDHTIRTPQTFVVEDATKDERFMNNPAVKGEPHVRYYAGAPLWTRDGYCIGSVCVLDVKPGRLSEAQQKGLEALARQVMALIETRSIAAEAQLDHLQLKNTQDRLQAVTSDLEAGILTIDSSGKGTFVNEAWCRQTGLTREQSLGYTYLSAVVEEDRVALFDRMMQARRERTAFKAFARVRKADGTLRHLECHSVPLRTGGRLATTTDVTEYVERIEALEKELNELKAPMLKKAE